MSDTSNLEYLKENIQITFPLLYISRTQDRVSPPKVVTLRVNRVHNVLVPDRSRIFLINTFFTQMARTKQTARKTPQQLEEERKREEAARAAREARREKKKAKASKKRKPATKPKKKEVPSIFFII